MSWVRIFSGALFNEVERVLLRYSFPRDKVSRFGRNVLKVSSSLKIYCEKIVLSKYDNFK